jgi:hypothetical protein
MNETQQAPKSAPNGHHPVIHPAQPDIVTYEERQRAPQPEPPSQPPAPPPLHFLAALATIALDWIWYLVELPATLSLIFLPELLPLSLSLAVVDFTVVSLVQHFLAGERWAVALTKGLVMGIIAGVPYPVFGTIVGVPLAAWAGIREIQKRLPPKI